MTSLLGGAGIPFPGAYSPQNPYSWLDDLPESQQGSTGNTHDSNPFTKSSSKANSPASIIDLTNSNGKRALESLASSAYGGEPDPKRMRIKHEDGSRPTGDQQGTPARPIHVDLSGSRPPTHRSNLDVQHDGHHPPFAGPSTRTPAQRSSSNTWTSSNGLIRSMNSPQADAKEAAPIPTPFSSRRKLPSQSIIKEESDARAAPFATRGPFDVDDSSDDERTSKPVQSLRTPSTSPPPVAENKKLRSQPQMAMSQRERQLLESRKRRQETTQRKRDIPSSSRGTPDKVHLKEGSDGEVEVDHARSHPDRGRANDFRTGKAQTGLFQTPASHTSPAKDSVIDLTADDAKNIPTKSRPQEDKRLSKVTGSIQKPRTIYEEGRRSREFGEATLQKNAELHARVQALDNKEKEQAEVRRAAEAKRKKESDELQEARARMQEEYDRQATAQAEMAKRSRARVEANRLEAQQEAEAKRNERRKREAEQKKWDEKERIKDEHREALRKRQAEEDKEKRCLGDQQAALARLNAVRPPQQAPKESPREEQKAETDMNQIVSKHTPQTGLHFKRDNGSMAADAARNKVKKIQDRNAQGGLLQSKPVSTPESSRREERIKALEEKNARLREAERCAGEDEDDGKDADPQGQFHRQSQDAKHPLHHAAEAEKRDSGAPAPSPAPLALPKGPQSLSSAAGQALLAHANANQTKTRDGTLLAGKRKNHGRQLGEILPEDIRLVKWRDDGMQFKEIALLWAKQFGASRSADTLRSRYKQVKEALRSVDVKQHLLDLMLNGSTHAREEVNCAVHGRWPLSDAPKSQRAAQDHFAPKHGQSGDGDAGRVRAAATVPRSGLLSPKLTNSFVSSTTEETVAADENAGRRSDVGGKRLGPEAYAYFLESIREVYAEDEPDVPSPREQSPVCEEDYYHFAYQVQRREISQEDLDEGFVITEEDVWQVCDEPLDKLSRANKKAAKEAACIPKKWKHEGDSDPEYQISSRNLNDGRKMFKTIWHGIGEVQVRVARYTLYPHDNVRPTSKDGWAPKSIYFVRERKAEKTGDDVFAESREVDVTRDVDNAVYTALEEANTTAIQHFVSIAFESKSANLTQRKIEEKEMVKKIEGELAEEEGSVEEEGSCFRREIETEDGRRKVEVWVEKGKLKGPRNL